MNTYYNITILQSMLPPPVLGECRHCICQVMANFTPEFEIRNMSLGMREDSAFKFVTEATKTGHRAVFSFMGQINKISINIGQFEGFLQEMFLLHLLKPSYAIMHIRCWF